MSFLIVDPVTFNDLATPYTLAPSFELRVSLLAFLQPSTFFMSQT